MLKKALLSVLITIVILRVQANDKPCKSRDYGNGGTVCVCNSTYCDTITAPEEISTVQYHIYTSNKAGKRFEHQIGEFTNKISKNIEVSIDSNTKYQTIYGFGGAFTDSTAINIQALNTYLQNHLIRSYFSEEGIEYSLGRVPIGGTDFSTHAYSYVDGDADKSLESFKLSPEDHILKIPLIKEALRLRNNNLQLFASAWTAPKWMKTNNDYSGFGFLIESMYETWADYFVKFLDLYDEQGIDFWGITTGNEPSLGFIPFGKINSVGWFPNNQGEWIRDHLGPAIRNSKHGDLKIMALDDQRFFLPWFIDIVLENNATRDYIDGFAVHWYYDRLFSADLLKQTHEKYPEKFLLATEACVGDKPLEKHVDLGSWERGERYANSIIEDLSNFVSGWLDWNMALDETGGPTYIGNNVDSPIIVNVTGQEIYKQPMFYALGHFSKFISAGSVRVKSDITGDEDISVISFLRPDNKTVIVILNKEDAEVNITLTDKTKGTSILLSDKSVTTLVYD